MSPNPWSKQFLGALPLATLLLFVADFVTGQSSGDQSLEIKAWLLSKANDWEAPRITFSDTSTQWNDIPKLLKSENMAKAEQLCVIGTWLLYQEADFVVPSLPTVFLLSEVNKKACITMDDIGGKLGSMQALTPFSNKTGATLGFFRDLEFGGNAILLHKSRPPTADLSYVGAVTIVGPFKFQIRMTDSTLLCLQPKPQDNVKYPVCLISNLIDNEKVKPGGVTSARRGCKASDGALVVEMKFCLNQEGGLQKLETGWPFDPPKVNATNNETSGCTPDSTEPSDDLDKGLKDLIDQRINGTLSTGDVMSAITNSKNVWKTELLERTSELFQSICTNSVTNTEYMLLVEAVYMHHLNKAWEGDKFLNTSVSEEAWREINYDMMVCNERIPDVDFSFVTKETVLELQNYKSISDIKSKIDKVLGFRSQYDHVMEINWRMANLVASICYRALGYDINFLTRYLNIYHELYFLPVMEQWTNPGKYVKAYTYIFGGYGMEKSMLELSLCTLNALQASSIIDHYLRPQDQKDKVFLPTPAP